VEGRRRWIAAATQALRLSSGFGSVPLGVVPGSRAVPGLKVCFDTKVEVGERIATWLEPTGSLQGGDWGGGRRGGLGMFGISSTLP
jgi:hypothetical protein